MKDFTQEPHGATGADAFRNDSAVPSGWRKATPDLAMAERYADLGQGRAVEKGRAFVAVKRVGAHIGLKAGDMLLLDTLGAFTKSQDWDEGQRAIVWASNAFLMEQTGFSLSALKRHARRLAEAGVIAFRDSPNGKRWGHRDGEGRIVEAYGFDLSPLAARAEEFEVLHAERQAERALCQHLKRQITVARRMIRARIEAMMNGAAHGPWGELVASFERLLDRLPRRHATVAQLQRLSEQFSDLREQIETEFLTKDGLDYSKETQEMDPSGVKSEPHIRITKELHPITCNPSETEDVASTAPNNPALDDWVIGTRKTQATPDLPVVMQACPEFATWARNMGGFIKNWADLHRITGQLRPMIGISEHAWNVAQDRLGPQVATAAFALVFEKHSAGEVASPGGYLRGMVEKAGAGKLHLERSFYGRLSGQAA